MLFNSIYFLIFFLAFFQIYWTLNNKYSYTFRNIFTILASYIFYACWDWRFLGLIVLSSIVDYTIGLQLEQSTQQNIRKRLLAVSILVNLGMLGFFKYCNFFIDSLNEIFHFIGINVSTSTLQIILPVGISFYTFQTMSYTIDIYRKKLKATHDVFSFFAFVAFFPQLIAGPIERASSLLGQFREQKQFSYEQSVAGMRLVLWGMFQKIVIADNFGVIVDQIFDTSSDLSGVTTLLGAFLFSFQIYADFAGYSNMAIGLSRMIGIDLMRNFNTPYFSSSMREFWQRWHISLSTWFRDYVYIPLGGSRVSVMRTSFNLLTTFFLSGLWHGANVTFLIWGALHGLLLIFEKSFKIKTHRSISSLLVFTMVALLWIPFRAENIGQLSQMYQSIFQWSSYSLESLRQILTAFSIIKIGPLIFIFILFLLTEYQFKLLDFNEWITQKHKGVRIAFYYALVLSILFLGDFAAKPQFIYFQF